MTAPDETATDVAVDQPQVYRPRSASAHVSASQPTGLTAPTGTAPARSAPRR